MTLFDVDEPPEEPEPRAFGPRGDSRTVDEVRAWLSSVFDSGAPCPCCDQLVKLYQRKLPAPTARALIVVYQESEEGFVHLPSLVAEKLPWLAGQGGYAGTMARHWALIEGMPAQRDDGSDRTGMYRLTMRGRLFVRGLVAIPKYALLYNDELLGHVGPDVFIREALGHKFDYDELMAGHPTPRPVPSGQ